MVQIKFRYDWPTGCGDIRVWKCPQTHSQTHRRRLDRYTISSSRAFGSGELNKYAKWVDFRGGGEGALPFSYAMNSLTWGLLLICRLYENFEGNTNGVDLFEEEILSPIVTNYPDANIFLLGI